MTAHQRATLAACLAGLAVLALYECPCGRPTCPVPPPPPPDRRLPADTVRAIVGGAG